MARPIPQTPTPRSGRTARTRHAPWSRRTITCLVLVVPLLAAGCGSGETGSPAAENAISYSYWGGSARVQLTDSVVDLFTQANPGVGIETQTASNTTNYLERLAVQVAGGNAPDAFQMRTPQLAEFAAQEAMLPLDEYVSNGTIDVSGIPPGMLDSGRIDGVLYMIPSSASINTMLFNPKLMEAAGVAPLTNDTTWADLASAAKSMARAGLPAGVYPTLNFCFSDSPFFEYLGGNGVDPFTPDGLGFGASEVTDWLDYWKDLGDAGALPPPAVQTEQEGDSAEDSMIAKNTVVISTRPANQFNTVAALSADLDMVSLPDGPQGPGQAVIVSGQSISANTEKPDLAARWIDYFVNDPQGAVAYEADNGVPVDQEARQAVADAVPHKQFSVFEEMLKDDLQAMEFLAGTGELQTALTRACDSVAFGNQTSEQAAQQFMTEMAAEVR
jgi:pectin-derived oligosaccharide transport system substrate-binding protein